MSARFQNTITVPRYVPTYQAPISVSVVKASDYIETKNDAAVSVVVYIICMILRSVSLYHICAFVIKLFYCVDINECKNGLHDCEHICVNNHGSYECKCQDGYEPGTNKSTCKGNLL